MTPTTGGFHLRADTQIRVRIPRHVAYQSFVTETVVLDLDTGRYHELEHGAGALLAALESSASLALAAAALASDRGRPVAELESQCLELCVRLAEHGLIELDPLEN